MDSKPTVADMMAAYAQDAVDHAQASSGIALDFSQESIERVEDILEQLHSSLPRGILAKLFGRGPSRQDIETMAKMYGGYIGEVWRRTTGGEWSFDTETVPGHQSICFTKADYRVWPVAKVYKRITVGSGDNVWWFSRVLLQRWQ